MKPITVVIDLKALVIMILSIALVVVGYIAFKHSDIPYDQKFTEAQLKELKHEKDSLLIDIGKRQGEKEKARAIIDSLQKLKPRIQIQYDKKYKDVDNASASTVINQFKDVLSKGGVK